MRLYIYSHDRLAFVDVTWVLPAVVAGFFVIAMVVSFDGLMFPPTDGGTRSRTAASWTIENDIIRYQTRLLNARLSSIERTAEELETLIQIQSQVHSGDGRAGWPISDPGIVFGHVSKDRPRFTVTRSGS